MQLKEFGTDLPSPRIPEWLNFQGIFQRIGKADEMS